MGVGGMLLAVPLFAAGYRLIREDVVRRNPEAEIENVDESIFVDEEKKEKKEEVQDGNRSEN